MSKKDVHVTPRPAGGWGVGREGGQRQSSLHDTQAAAAAEGRRLARNDSGKNGAPSLSIWDDVVIERLPESDDERQVASSMPPGAPSTEPSSTRPSWLASASAPTRTPPAKPS